MTGFFTLIEREFYRFWRLFRQTVVPPVVTTLLFVLIFGYSLGSRIREISGFPYIVYILPGLIAMGVITNAYANSSTSLFMSRLERSIENIMAAPFSYLQLVTALAIGGILRGLVVGGVTLGVALVMTPLHIQHWGLSLLALFLLSAIFSCFGIISALYSESWDQISTFTNFFLTPFVYLGGVFYSIRMLPGIWQKISLFNPLFYLIDLVRYAALGLSDVPLGLSLSIAVGLTLVSFAVCVWLFKIGYKLVS